VGEGKDEARDEYLKALVEGLLGHVEHAGDVEGKLLQKMCRKVGKAKKRDTPKGEWWYQKKKPSHPSSTLQNSARAWPEEGSGNGISPGTRPRRS